MNKVVETICNAKWYVVWSELEEYWEICSICLFSLCV